MACNRPPSENAVKARVLMLRRADPNLSYAVLAERTGQPARTIRRWVSEAGLGQGLRTEDARGQTPRPGRLHDITREHLDALDEFEDAEGGVTAKPRNQAVPDSCAESL